MLAPVQEVQVPEEAKLLVHDAEGAWLAPSSEGSLVFRDHEDFAPAVEAAALAVGGVAFPNDSREVAPAHTENVA